MAYVSAQQSWRNQFVGVCLGWNSRAAGSLPESASRDLSMMDGLGLRREDAVHRLHGRIVGPCFCGPNRGMRSASDGGCFRKP
jgi:hypothetical protein